MRLAVGTICGLVLLVANVGVAGEATEDAAPAMRRGLQDGTFVDEYFGLEYAARGLKAGVERKDVDVVFAGRCAEIVEVEIQILEAPGHKTPVEWRAAHRAAWKPEEEGQCEIEEGDKPAPWILHVRESPAGFRRHYGSAFHSRGCLAILIHAQIREKTDDSGALLRDALAGLSVEPAPRDAFLLAHRAAARYRTQPDDPRNLLAAGETYAHPSVSNLPLAARALALAEAGVGATDFDEDEAYRLYAAVGALHLHNSELEKALPALVRATEHAALARDPGPLLAEAYYNLACAYARLNRLDEAFQALQTCYERGSVVRAAELQNHALEDPDLASMRADPRWERLLEDN